MNEKCDYFGCDLFPDWLLVKQSTPITIGPQPTRRQSLESIASAIAKLANKLAAIAGECDEDDKR